MFNTIAFITAISLLSVQPAAAAADVSAELIWEDHYSQEGVEVDLYVTEGADGAMLSEATLRDLESSGTEVDVWTNGVTVWWHGTIDGERASGSAPAVDFGDPQEAAFCFTPVTAIICLGAIVVLVGTEGCYGKGFCVPDDSNVPGGAGGVPGDGGGGDGDGDGDGSGSAGGDDD